MRRTGALVLAGLGGLLACAAAELSTQSEPPHAQGATGHAVKSAVPPGGKRAPAAPLSPRADTVPSEPCPSDMAAIGRACMDRYEAHLVLLEDDGRQVLHAPHDRPTSPQVIARSQRGVKPQAYISQVEAANACSNAGKRLCSLAEWYGACTGGGSAQGATTYPYGREYESGRCNVGKPHLLSLLHGSDPRGWGYADFNDPELAKREGFLALTGEYAGCAGPSGVHDLVGNLHEWVADRVDGTLPRKLPLKAVIERRIGKTKGNGIFMGGFYSTTNEHGSGCRFITAAHEPRYHDYSTGFRCCGERRDPPPPTKVVVRGSTKDRTAP